MSQLQGWRPSEVTGAGEDLLRRAGDLQSAAGDLSGVRGQLAGVWSGTAADAATAHTGRRADEVDELAALVQYAGRALVTAGEALGQAQAVLRGAVDAAHATGCMVLNDGSVVPPARPPVPGGLMPQELTVWQEQADATASAQADRAARLAQQIAGALDAAGAADAVAASSLGSLSPPQISPAPRPVLLSLSGGDWGDWGAAPVGAPAGRGEGGGHWWDGAVHQAEGLVNGVRDGVVEPVKMVGGLVGLHGDTSDNWAALGGGLAHGATHPVDFGKALIGWDDLAAGEYGHWAGELVPGIAAAFATGGAAAAVKGGDAAAATARAGQALRLVRKTVDDRLAAGGLARDAGVLDLPAARPRLGQDRGDGRDVEGKFAGSSGYGKAAEAAGLRAYERETGRTVIRTQVRATLSDGSTRYYDGLALKANGTYEGIEVKSGTANLEPNQRNFDGQVNTGAAAQATLNGQPIKITSVQLRLGVTPP